ncbi:hypothetical protein TXYLGN1_24640 [Tepidimicrobium xylanilyticum]
MFCYANFTQNIEKSSLQYNEINKKATKIIIVIITFPKSNQPYIFTRVIKS